MIDYSTTLQFCKFNPNSTFQQDRKCLFSAFKYVHYKAGIKIFHLLLSRGVFSLPTLSVQKIFPKQLFEIMTYFIIIVTAIAIVYCLAYSN